MFTVLVTGGAGFIGSNFCHYRKKEYPNSHIVVLDALTYAGDKANLAGVDVDFYLGSISQPAFVEALFGKYKFDIVVNFAAETHVDRSIKSAHEFIQTNVLGTQVLIDNALRHQSHFHQVSTDEVYGSLGPYDYPFTENSPYRPNSPYAASKAAADHLVRAAMVTHRLSATISHGCNTFGPCQHQEKLIPTLVSHSMRGLPMPLYGNGTNRREWIFVNRHCEAIDLIIKRGREGCFNIGSGIELSNIEMAKIVGGEIEFVEDRPGHDFRYALNSEKLMGIGYKPPSYSEFLHELSATIKWYRGNSSCLTS